MNIINLDEDNYIKEISETEEGIEDESNLNIDAN